jgi:hypothetical protein
MEADMIPRIPENGSGWLAECSPVTLIDDMLPPRDPNVVMTTTKKKRMRTRGRAGGHQGT